MKHIKHILPIAFASIASMVACDPDDPTPPEPPKPPKPTTQTILVDTADEYRAALDTPARDNHTTIIEWENDMFVTPQNDNVIGDGKDNKRSDIIIKDNGRAIYYGPTVVDYPEYARDTKSHRVTGDKNGVWHYASDAKQQALWNNPNIVVFTVNTTLDVSHTDAHDFGYIERILKEYEGNIFLNNADSMHLRIEYLTNINTDNIKTGGRVFVSGMTTAVILGTNQTMEYAWGDGTSRSAEFAAESEMDGVTTQFWLRGTRPTTANEYSPITVGKSMIGVQNVYPEYFIGQKSWSPDAIQMIDAPLLGVSLLPLGVYYKQVDDLGVLPEKYPFRLDGENGIATYQDKALSSKLNQAATLSDISALENSVVIEKWLLDNGIASYKKSNMYRFKQQFYITRGEMDAKTYGDVVAIEAPSWVTSRTR